MDVPASDMRLPVAESELAEMIDKFYHLAVRGSISAVILLAIEWGFELGQRQVSEDDQV